MMSERIFILKKIYARFKLGITVLSTSIGKMFFAWRFILDEYLLFRLSEAFCLFCFCFCSQIFTLKLNLRPKVGLTYAISIVK